MLSFHNPTTVKLILIKIYFRGPYISVWNRLNCSADWPDRTALNARSSIRICNWYIRRPKSLRWYHHVISSKVVQDSSGVAAIATGWTFLGSNPGGSGIFRTLPDRRWGPPSALYNRCRDSCPGVKRGDVVFTTHSHLAPKLKKAYNYTSTPLQAFITCSRVD